MIAKAKNPLLLIGSQGKSTQNQSKNHEISATLAPVKPLELQQTVNELGIPCYLGGMARGLLGSKPKLQMRQNRRGALKEADLVIMAGAVADFRLDYGKLLSPNSKVVVINRDQKQLKKVSKIVQFIG